MNTKQDKTKNTKIHMYDIRSEYLYLIEWVSLTIGYKKLVDKYIENSILLIRAVYNCKYDTVKNLINSIKIPQVTIEICERISIFNDDFKMFNMFYDPKYWGDKNPDEIHCKSIRIAMLGEATKMLKWLLHEYPLRYIDTIKMFDYSLENNTNVKILSVLFDDLSENIFGFSLSKILESVRTKRFEYGKTEFLNYMINHDRFDINVIHNFLFLPNPNNIDKSCFNKYIILNSKIDSFEIFTSMTRIYTPSDHIKQLVMIYIGKLLVNIYILKTQYVETSKHIYLNYVLLNYLIYEQ